MADLSKPFWFKLKGKYVLCVELNDKHFLFTLTSVRKASIKYNKYINSKDLYYSQYENDRHMWHGKRTSKRKQLMKMNLYPYPYKIY